MATEVAELEEQFGPALSNDKDLLQECLTLTKIHNISPQELFYKWEAFSIRMGNEVKLNHKHLALLKQELQEDLEKSAKNDARLRSNVKPSPGAAIHSAKSASSLDSVLGISPSTPVTKRKAPSKQYETPIPNKRALNSDDSPAPSPLIHGQDSPRSAETPFSKRKNAGKLVEQLNPGLAIQKQLGSIQTPSIVANFQLKKYNYKNMYQRLMDVSEVLDEAIDEAAEYLTQSHQIQLDEIANPAETSQSDVVVVGRIATDSSSGGRPTANSLIIESSRRLGAGSRVLLKLDQVPSCSLYPGQIVAAKGNNPNGNFFAVKEFLEIPIKGSASSTLAELEASPGQALDVFIAAGPYTTGDNLLYEALEAIVEKVESERPDVVVLAGPFVDSQHASVRNGDFEGYEDLQNKANGLSIEDLFVSMVTPRLNNISESTVILVNSLREWGESHRAWPQAAIDRKLLGLKSNFKCVPNPAMFTINGTVFGTSTNDIISHLSKEEFSRAPQRTNMLERLVSHVISSGKFYPLFPGAASDPAHGKVGSNLDVAMLGLSDFGNSLPDVLILPSEMYHFIKVINNVISINPGPAAKPLGAGSYVRMFINPTPTVSSTDGESEYKSRAHETFNHSRTDLYKL